MQIPIAHHQVYNRNRGRRFHGSKRQSYCYHQTIDPKTRIQRVPTTTEISGIVQRARKRVARKGRKDKTDGIEPRSLSKSEEAASVSERTGEASRGHTFSHGGLPQASGSGDQVHGQAEQ